MRDSASARSREYLAKRSTKVPPACWTLASKRAPVNTYVVIPRLVSSEIRGRTRWKCPSASMTKKTAVGGRMDGALPHGGTTATAKGCRRYPPDARSVCEPDRGLIDTTVPAAAPALEW